MADKQASPNLRTIALFSLVHSLLHVLPDGDLFQRQFGFI